MKILFIRPGSGDGYYCGNCFRDSLQAQALRKAGHDVIIMPLYLPLKRKALQNDVPLFFPATTFYVEQKLFGNSSMPGWMKKMLGSKALLNLASALSGTTSAKGMESMTLSMIEGEGRAFQENVAQLLDYVENVEQPDVVQLSTTLLLGIAKELKRVLPNIPLVCSMQDEEVWIDSLEQHYASQAWDAIAQNAQYVDRFITTSHYYKQVVARKFPELPVQVIYPGIDADRYKTDSRPEYPTIGFFYRMNELDGLDILADAFVDLKKRNSIPNLKLRIGGGYMGNDKQFVENVRRILRPYAADVVMEEDYDTENHAAFYEKISVLSVPLRFQEGVGLYLCEAFAAGRPAVEPNTGSFPEIVGNAGLIYQPQEGSKALADSLEYLLLHPDVYNECSSNALKICKERYNDDVLAQELKNLYESIITLKH